MLWEVLPRGAQSRTVQVLWGGHRGTASDTAVALMRKRGINEALKREVTGNPCQDLNLEPTGGRGGWWPSGEASSLPPGDRGHSQDKPRNLSFCSLAFKRRLTPLDLEPHPRT